MTRQARPYKYFVFFVVAFITCYLTQETLLNRLIAIGPNHYITGGTFIYFTSPLIIDVVAEVYGYKEAKTILLCGLFSLLFAAVCVSIVLKMPAPNFWGRTISAYNISLGTLSKATIVSTLSVFVGQSINAYLINKWKILLRGRRFWLRSLGSSVVGDSVTVALTTIFVFGGRVPPGMFTANIIPELIVMISFTALGAIPAVFIARLTEKAEGYNYSETAISFNPFA